MPVIDNTQPTLALTESFVMEGVFEGHDSGGGIGLGFLRIFAGNFGLNGQPLADGRLISIASNTAVFSEIGTTYGGNGTTNYALPDLRGRLAVGMDQGFGLPNIDEGEQFGSNTFTVNQTHLSYHSGGSSQPLDNEQSSLGLRYMIQIEGIFPSQGGGGGTGGNFLLGNVGLFAGGYNPAGWAECAGQLLSIQQNQALFALLGTTYGGNGITTFALPDLRGRTVIGAGQGPGLSNYVLGQQIGTPTTTITDGTTPADMGGQGLPGDNHQPSLALNYVIALSGIYPTNDGGGYEDQEDINIGEIMATAVNFAPSGFAICAGQLLLISQNTALFSILGTTYGGDGKSTFALPDLRGRSIIGTDDNHILGQQDGSETYSLSSNFSSLTINDSDDGHTLFGGDANDLIMGNGGNDTLDGGLGADSLYGGTGDDTYVVNDVADLVIEKDGEGTDTINSSVSFTLVANVENLTLTGSANIDGIGNSLDNVMMGNAGKNTLKGMDGNDWLDGGAGVSTLYGGSGNDTYVVHSTNDKVSETLGGTDNGGIDTVRSSVTFTLGVYFENLILTGTNAINGTGNDLDNQITGNDANNTLTGLGGNDFLDGAGGSDTMVGGIGNDTYVVGNKFDVVTENVNEGTDEVRSSITYTLGANVENLTLTGYADINGTGNSVNNIIYGNVGNNILDGGAGADTMYGGSGDDTYIVGNAFDKAIENINEGTNDTVQASVTYTIGANIENLVLTGTTDINGTGNVDNNDITGNSGNNILDGKGGADFMAGGLGNDTYIVDNGDDSIQENANGGTDLVKASVDYTLDDNLENLTLTGTLDISGTGNNINNIIIGNSGNNWIDGQGGADAMSGGQGNDTYIVGNAFDTVTENVNEGNDTVQSSVTFTLGANVENLVLTGSNNINGTGNTLNNVITGNTGNNVLNGGGGADTFVFGSSFYNGLDHVVDFTSGQDHLSFKGSDYNIAAGSSLDPSQLSLTGAAVGYGAQFVYDPASHTLYWDGDGQGLSAAPIALVVFNNGAAPAVGDFVFT